MIIIKRRKSRRRNHNNSAEIIIRFVSLFTYWNISLSIKFIKILYYPWNLKHHYWSIDWSIDWVIDFNCMVNHLGLFSDLRLESYAHCTFLLLFKNVNISMGVPLGYHNFKVSASSSFLSSHHWNFPRWSP